MKMKNQTSDAANASKSGGVMNQGGTLDAREHKPDSVSSASNIPAKGTSNGSK